MRLPFVSRERLEEAQRYADQSVATLKEQLRESALRESHLLAIIEDVAKGFTKPSTGATPTDTPERAPFTYPPEILAAIRQRAPIGSQLEARLLREARERLSFGDTEPEDVVKTILSGSDAFDSDSW